MGESMQQSISGKKNPTAEVGPAGGRAFRQFVFEIAFPKERAKGRTGLRRALPSAIYRPSDNGIRCTFPRKLHDCRGQSTVEAVFVIPVLFVLMLLLLQPGIILYDRIVMGNAAAEGCRLLATATDAAGSMQGSCEAFIRHRLASIPQHDCFHVHDGSCSWQIEFSGNESSRETTVTIRNELKLFPLFDAGSKLLGMANGEGNLVIEESVTLPTQPQWAASSPSGTSPADWIGAWAS